MYPITNPLEVEEALKHLTYSKSFLDDEVIHNSSLERFPLQLELSEIKKASKKIKYPEMLKILKKATQKVSINRKKLQQAKNGKFTGKYSI